MIILGYIEFQPKSCVGWIIVMDLRVLLNMHYLIRRILVKSVLDIYERSKCKNKKFLDLDVVTMHFLKKNIYEKNICVGLHMENYMFLMKPW